jgi:tetratricopeptide (TPR) repeat protein
MSPDPLTAYEQLTPEEAAQIDTVCDRFERAWKEAKAGGPVPHFASYLGPGHGSAHEVLFQELIALDRACRERYGLSVRPEDSKELGAGLKAPATSTTCPLHRRTDVPGDRPVDWPSIPGLELMEVLGSGGMAVVFKARQAILDRDVAVKFLRDPYWADSVQRERFLQEARAVARLRHPHLVQVYEFGELPAVGGATSQPYLVLEYMSGGSLADLVRGSPLPPGEAARLVETLADAIHYAHQQGVIHRDLKPANILLARIEDRGSRIEDRKGSSILDPRSSTLDPRLSIPKITDFGLAKFLAGSDLTHSGYVVGTPSYMAPEQATGKSGPITAAVDVYGLGAVLYEALTARPPFAAATVDATLGLVRQDEPVPPRRLQPTVPRDLETICLKCLHKEAGRRYATAQDLADDLRRFRAGEPIRARPVGMGERVVGWCRRKPGVAALLAALVLVFLAGSSGILWQWQCASRNAAEAERNAEAFQRERDTARQETARAERRLQMLRDQLDGLKQRGRDLLRRPGQYRTGQALLEEAVVFYQKLLPEQGNDPKLRREAADAYAKVAEIQHTLGQATKAADAHGRRARLLSSLLEEDPGNKDLRNELADAHRWQGNALRDLGRARGAREAYDQAAVLHKALLDEFPDDADYQVALANTLLNTATLLTPRAQAEELESLYRRALKLNRAALRSKPDDPGISVELAIGLEDQGLFFLETGRSSEAQAAVREALAIHQKVLAEGRFKGDIELYAARSFVSLGRILAAADHAPEAVKSYQEAVKLLDGLVARFPQSARARSDLAWTLAGLADLLKKRGCRHEALETCRRAIREYETLKADFPEAPQHWGNLVRSYLELVSLLWELGRQTEAAEPNRKALEVNPEDPLLNNDLA